MVYSDPSVSGTLLSRRSMVDDSMREAVKGYMEGLTRYLVLAGLAARSLSVDSSLIGAHDVGLGFLVLIRTHGDRLVGIRLCNSRGEDI